MPVIDASSVVHAWDNYPINNFPKFWNWINTELVGGSIVIPVVAFMEIGHVSPDCHDWLKGNQIGKAGVSAVIAKHAKNIKQSLGIANDKYGTGVDENDIIIIATAKAMGMPLISNEAKQPSLPGDMKKYKIPAVCDMPLVGVTCHNIAEHIKQSNQVF